MIAQLVEHDLAKVGVASSSLVHRSLAGHVPAFFYSLKDGAGPDGGIGRRVRFRCACREVCRFESCSGHKTPVGIQWGPRKFLIFGESGAPEYFL